MKPTVRHRIANLSPLGQCLVVALVLGIGLLLAGPVALALRGADGFWAAVAAALTVLVASIAALLTGELFHGPGDALWAMLTGMGIRMAAPLAACILVYLQQGTLASAGFVFFVLGFYFVALPVETLLAVSKVARNHAG